ncbi:MULTISPECIES: FMN-binding protein [unclassified Aeromicrobium]|uniref:FMN-binding protein n=1 Tax=unclassified Aeromicrobium TaxID=2633570 RepID=UPI00288C107D|nr:MULTISPECIES: FMN-binding protein [unclassified Aeromicrobium]
MTLRRHQKALLALTATSTLLLTAACGSDADSDAGSSSSSSATSEATDDSGSSEASGDYTAGTYEASGSYSNPAGTSEVDVEITLGDGGVIDDVTVTPKASGTSKQYQDKFAGGIADEVVGKNIDDIDVSKVAGSSLTSGGFNEAVDQIKSEAQA